MVAHSATLADFERRAGENFRRNQRSKSSMLIDASMDICTQRSYTEVDGEPKSISDFSNQGIKV